MADELDDADAQIRAHGGFENEPHGRIIARIFRHLLALRTVVVNLRDAVIELRAAVAELRAADVDLDRRLDALENPPPPPG